MAGPDKGHTVMVEEAMLPLADASVDRLLAVHCLETSERSDRCCARSGGC